MLTLWMLYHNCLLQACTGVKSLMRGYGVPGAKESWRLLNAGFGMGPFEKVVARQPLSGLSPLGLVFWCQWSCGDGLVSWSGTSLPNVFNITMVILSQNIYTILSLRKYFYMYMHTLISLKLMLVVKQNSCCHIKGHAHASLSGRT